LINRWIIEEVKRSQERPGCGPEIFLRLLLAEIAAMKKLSDRTVQRMWEKARIYLHCSIRTDLSL
jgi:hypothetical protein